MFGHETYSPECYEGMHSACPGCDACTCHIDVAFPPDIDFEFELEEEDWLCP